MKRNIRIITLLVCMLLVNIPVCKSQDLQKFWDDVTANSKEYNAYKKNKSSLKNSSLSEFLPVKKAYSSFYTSMQNRNLEYANQLSHTVFGEDSVIKSIVFFDDEYEPNAGIDSNGHIEIGITLYDLLSKEEFIAVIAHEAAHLKLKHHEIGYLNYKKEERKQKIAAGIAQTLYASSVVYSDYVLSKNNLKPTNKDYFIPTMVAISDGFRRSIEFNQKIYNKEQEVEADFAAAKFLEHIWNWKAASHFSTTKNAGLLYRIGI